jgi:hypothetical protein
MDTFILKEGKSFLSASLSIIQYSRDTDIFVQKMKNSVLEKEREKMKNNLWPTRRKFQSISLQRRFHCNSIYITS